MAKYDNPQGALEGGRKTVTTAGTAVQLATTSTEIGWVTITALEANTGVIVVSGSGVVAASGTRKGLPLAAKDSVSIPTDNLTDVWIDSTVNGEGVSYMYGV